MENIERFANDADKYQTVLEIRYGVRYNELHARLFGRVAGLLSFLQIVFGSMAFAGYIAIEPIAVGWSGLLLAICTALSFTLDPSSKSARFSMQRDAMNQLNAIAHNYSTEELIHSLTRLQASALPGEIDAFRNIARNDVLYENGRSDAIQNLSGFEYFVKRIF